MSSRLRPSPSGQAQPFRQCWKWPEKVLWSSGNRTTVAAVQHMAGQRARDAQSIACRPPLPSGEPIVNCLSASSFPVSDTAFFRWHFVLCFRLPSRAAPSLRGRLFLCSWLRRGNGGDLRKHEPNGGLWITELDCAISQHRGSGRYSDNPAEYPSPTRTLL
ncbi:hypothetical protein D3C78_1459180 [compost metagenome]